MDTSWCAAKRSVLFDPDLRRWADRCRDTLASCALTDPERALAMRLLSLSFTSGEELAGAVAAVVGG